MEGGEPGDIIYTEGIQNEVLNSVQSGLYAEPVKKENVPGKEKSKKSLCKIYNAKKLKEQLPLTI